MQSSIPTRAGCGALYVTHQLGGSGSSSSSSLSRIALARPVGAARPPGSGGGVKAASAAPAPPPPPPDYSVLGQGYNVLTALPLSVGMSSLDPGLT